MGPAAIPLMIASTAVSAGASIAGARQQKKAGKLQQRQADRQAALERRKMVREARIRRAQVVNSAAQTGTQNSSGAISALGAIGQEAAVGRSNSLATQQLSQQISDRLQRSANFQTLGNVANSVGSASSAFIK